MGFCYTATGDCWYYNADVFMYSASLYKVPVSMLAAEKVAAGELSQEDDSMGVSLSYLEESALIYSNNDSGHMLVHLMGGTDWGKCSDQLIRYTDLDESYFTPDFYGSSFYTARFMTQVMRTLCEGGEERFPHVIENLLIAQPDSYLNLSLMGKYQVAQKYGAFEERNGNSNNHITAIVYTPNPIILAVMTRDVGNYEWVIGQLAARFKDYALTLDEKLVPYVEEKEAQEAAQEAEVQAQQAAEAQAQREEEARLQAERQRFLDEREKQDRADRHLKYSLVATVTGLLFLGVLSILFVGKHRKKKRYDSYRRRFEEELRQEAMERRHGKR